MDEGVVEGSADEALERADGVSKVGGLLGLCGFADGALLGAKGDEGGCRAVGDFVGDDVDAATTGDTDLG